MLRTWLAQGHVCPGCALSVHASLLCRGFTQLINNVRCRRSTPPYLMLGQENRATTVAEHAKAAHLWGGRYSPLRALPCRHNHNTADSVLPPVRLLSHHLFGGRRSEQGSGDRDIFSYQKQIIWLISSLKFTMQNFYIIIHFYVNYLTSICLVNETFHICNKQYGRHKYNVNHAVLDNMRKRSSVALLNIFNRCTTSWIMFMVKSLALPFSIYIVDAVLALKCHWKILALA